MPEDDAVTLASAIDPETFDRAIAHVEAMKIVNRDPIAALSNLQKTQSADPDASVIEAMARAIAGCNWAWK